ncbi:type II 3-dehydroquinate dehydratase [Desulfosporosinus sp. BICA1-9]|uniref:type II 3-dehydroquinate dehydratase n=1 Tax=Desulfosporosinus sp. BICA1-9 TaxID=1531958 RepID=UPI00054C28A3|nr:type II 3-dehydroquinate dehydratase [Desulfosporosinus sp. BICA1-9]KJS49802.1 MAG: 3-dehydroquinate dehydratase [Peptococcaceae bacterium BRH_c23]KJS78808.1 MAG: 3-dehydroquinate dehydratase [Desulfosporosinus sp. BICA1-9]HBW36202.1 type II 3-dehydroquinate dehydratase [Desulfosporosinus sp.]
MASIWVFHGPNINLLGLREPEHYGSRTLAEINKEALETANLAGMKAECRQTNHEGELLDWIQGLSPDDFLILNPGAWTHTSYAIRDAISAVKVPTVEVHLSNIHAREAFRTNSLIAPVCIGQVSGLGADGYVLAMRYAVDYQGRKAKA